MNDWYLECRKRDVKISHLEEELARIKSAVADVSCDYRRNYCGESVDECLDAWADSVLNKGEGKG